MRQIVLDTETTGLRPEEGHRIIEVGCLELIDRKLTGRQFHYYINPERTIEAGAIAVHGITNEFLRDKPLFSQIVDELVTFINGAELIIHNAPFDIGFLNYEFSLVRRGFKTVNDYCSVLDTLQMARQMHVGQRNSLDALCKRYSVDNTKRELHGALLDADLLARVYLAMTGGQGSFFDDISETNASQSNVDTQSHIATSAQKHQLVVLKATDEELEEHAKYLEALKKRGKCVWDAEFLNNS